MRPELKSPRIEAAPLVIAILALLLISPGLLVSVAAAPSGEPGARGKAVIIIVDKVTPSNFPGRYTPFCTALASQGSVGLMGTRGAFYGDRDTENGGGYLSVGAGVKVTGAAGATYCFNSGEEVQGADGPVTAGELYYSLTGIQAPPDGVLCLDWQKVLENNEGSGNEGNLGLLGSLLGDSGREVAVVGNQDVWSSFRRPAPLLCSDESGLVPLGDVSRELLSPADDAIGGYVTDEAEMLERIRGHLPESDLLVVDTGETARIEYGSESVSDEDLEKDMAAALERADRLVRDIYYMLDTDESLLIILSPGAPGDARNSDNYETPCIVVGPGFQPGLLSSSTTRRQGLVSNTDVLPTILQFFDIEIPGDVTGSPMVSRSASGSLGYIQRIYDQVAPTLRARWPIIIAYVLMAMAFVVLVILTVPAVNRKVRWPRNPEKVKSALSPVSCFLLSAPLSFMLVSLFFYDGYLFPVFFCLLFSLLLGVLSWLAFRKRERINPPVFICSLTGAVLLADIFTGGRLHLLSLLGTTSLSDMRYFGFTNMTSQILVSTSVWAMAIAMGDWIVEKKKTRWVAFAILAGVALVIGAGSLGANFGGCIAAVTTFLVFIAACSVHRFKVRHVVGLIGASLVTVGIIVLLDFLFFQNYLTKSLTGGGDRLSRIIQNKAFIHLEQVQYFLIPSLLLLAAVITFTLLVRRRRSPFWRSQWQALRPQMSALFALLVGSLVAFIFNDTGITMIGIMALYSTLVVSYLYLEGSFPAPTIAPEEQGFPARALTDP